MSTINYNYNTYDSDIYKNLFIIENHIETGWRSDTDVTNDYQQLISIIDNIMSLPNLEDYFTGETHVLNYFMDTFSKDVIQYILLQYVVYGENGYDIAIDLLFHYVKLFIKFHNDKKYYPLFEKVKMIFTGELSNNFFKPSTFYKNKSIYVDPSNYEGFNDEFCSEFKNKNINFSQKFEIGEIVDIFVEIPGNSISRNVWVRGKIIGLDENDNYIVNYPGIKIKDLNKKIIQKDSFEIAKKGEYTKDWDWRMSLKRNDIVDCYDRGKWYPATLVKVEERIENDITIKCVTVGYRLYKKDLLATGKYNADDFMQFSIFWNNNDEMNDEQIGDKTGDDDLPIYSKRIQKFNTYCQIQREVLMEEYEQLYHSYNNNSMSNGCAPASPAINSNNKEQRLKIIRLLFENESADKNFDDLFYYEKDGKKNYIIGKKNQLFSYNFAKLLKKMADNGFFEDIIKILKDKPSIDDLKVIFSILMYSANFIHKEYFKQNYIVFKNAYLEVVEKLSTKDLKESQKQIVDLFGAFFIMINYILKRTINPSNVLIDEINLNVSIKMMSSSSFDKIIQGLKIFEEYLNSTNDESEIIHLIELIKKNNIIKELFVKNNHIQIITKSKTLLKLLLERNELGYEEVKLLWSLYEKGDFETKNSILKLINDLLPYIDSQVCGIFLELITKNKTLEEGENELLFELSIKTNNDKILLNFCDYYFKKVIEIKNSKSLIDNPSINKLVNLFGRFENFAQRIIKFCEDSLNSNNNAISIFYFLTKLSNKYKNEFSSYNDNNDFISKSIHQLIDNEKLLNIFKNNCILYKEKAKEEAKKVEPGNILMINGFTHTENMKYRITFLTKSIPIYYNNYDIFELLKKFCLKEPIYKTDKLLFYDSMKDFISSENNISDKIDIKKKLFDMLMEDNMEEIENSQFNLYIDIFLDINQSKGLMNYEKKNGEIKISNVKLDELIGIDKMWNLLFEIKDDNLAKKLIRFFYKLYENKNQIERLIQKCVAIIKDLNISLKKLEKCIKTLKFIIEESLENKIVLIKSHNDLLKDLIFNIKIKINNSSSFNLNTAVNHISNSKVNAFFSGNITIAEIKKYLAEMFNIEEQSIVFSYTGNLENNNNRNITLTNSQNNKTIKNLFSIFIDENDFGKENKAFPWKTKFELQGNRFEKGNLIQFGQLDDNFKSMLKEWFYSFSNGNDMMEKEQIFKYIEKITKTENVNENDINYINFMKESDKDGKCVIMDNEFLEYYNNLASTQPNLVWEHINNMGYSKNFKKMNNNSNLDEKNFPGYILGNDKEFHKALINHFSKYNINLIYQFLFLLSTNEEIYYELLKQKNITFNIVNNKDNNSLENLYLLYIIESFIQDIEVKNLNLNEIIKAKDKSKKNKYFDIGKETHEMILIDNSEFQDEKYYDDKQDFFINFIEKGGYESLIKYVEYLLNNINEEEKEKEDIKIKCCQKAIKLIVVIYNSIIEKRTNKDKYINIYYLVNDVSINTLMKNKNDDIEKIKKIISGISYINLVQETIKYLLNSKAQALSRYAFHLLINLLTGNGILLQKVKSNEILFQNLTSLMKMNIYFDNNSKFFVISLIVLLNNSNKQVTKLYYEFLSLLFEISLPMIKDVKNIFLDNKKNKISCSFNLFFDFFSNLFKTMLTYLGQFENNNNIHQFVIDIYEIIYKDILEKDKEKKLPEELFIGYMKILNTVINTEPFLRNEIVSKKIEGKTLFEIISQIIKQNSDENNNELSSNLELDLDVENLIYNLGDNNGKYLKIENLTEIISIIKNSNKNKNEETLSQKVFDTYNEYFLSTLTNSPQPYYVKIILNKLSASNSTSIISTNQCKSHSKKMPKVCGYVGLKNIGCTCYMNSILQQMYMIPSFRYAIMSVDDYKNKNFQKSLFNNNTYDDNLLHQLQKLYTFLEFSEKQAYNPKDFCASFKDMDGAPINPMIQQDSQEFFNNFCDKIEQSLKDTKYKYIIENIFTGKTCSSVICEQCKNVSNRFEDFYNLTLEIKNMNNLNESLNKFIEPEIIENFECGTCKKNVNISKRTSLAKLPNVLFIHLKRFNMNYESQITEKINSKFEFPNTLNLKNFCVENITKNENTGMPYETCDIFPKEDDYYQYELKGINVHLGNAQGGHYISFIDVERDGKDNEPNIKSSVENDVIKSKWLKFNDSVVSNFDVKEIPNESYGGYIDNNFKNENIQNAYLLIYERKKKYPIKIKLDSEDLRKNKIKIEFDQTNQSEINKLYNLGYLHKKQNLDKDLYDFIFCDKSKNEFQIYIPYYNVEKLVLKDNFIEVMNKNKKFFNKKVTLKCTNNTKEVNNELLLRTLNLKDFNILDKNFDQADRLNLINIFEEQAFYKGQVGNPDEETKAIYTSRAEIFLDKVICPIVFDTNKNDEYQKLVNKILNIFLNKSYLGQIFETTSSFKVFSHKIAKIVCELIYSILKYLYEQKENILSYMYLLLNFSETVTEEYIVQSGDDNSNQIEDGAYYICDLIRNMIKLNETIIPKLIEKKYINKFLQKARSSRSEGIKIILFEVISWLIEYTNYKGKGGVKIDSEQIDEIKAEIKNYEDLLFECSELYIKIIRLLQTNNKKLTNKFNGLRFHELFEKSKHKQNLTNILDLSLDIINIKDDLILDRLYSIMGIPEMVILYEGGKKITSKNNDNDSDTSDDEELYKQKNNLNEELKDCLPKFGCPLAEKGENQMIYSYVSVNTNCENQCILAQLFPAPSKNKFEITLTEEQRINYIYKLISIALLGEGNYALFKYIYLTQSRYIIKYNNLYEEIIDILSKVNKFDLTEIKKIGEICAKRVDFEVKTLKRNLKKLINCNKEEGKEEGVVEKIEKEKIEDEKIENEKIPELPDNMKNDYVEIGDVSEFSGFIPDHIPDKITKFFYKSSGKKNIKIITFRYYTTYKTLNQLREEIKNKKDNNKNEGENETKEIKNYTTVEENNSKGVNERDILKKIFGYGIEGQTLTIIPNMEKTEELSVYRIFLSSSEENILKISLNKNKMKMKAYVKYNCFIKDFTVFRTKNNKIYNIFQIYRKNMNLDFIDAENVDLSYRKIDQPFFYIDSDNLFD